MQHSGATGDLSRAFGTHGAQHQSSLAYGGAQVASGGAAAGNRADGLLTGSGVSHSALVNSGNAAILGHHSFKLNNNNAVNRDGGAAMLGNTYGAMNGPSHGQPSRDNIF